MSTKRDPGARLISRQMGRSTASAQDHPEMENPRLMLDSFFFRFSGLQLTDWLGQWSVLSRRDGVAPGDQKNTCEQQQRSNRQEKNSQPWIARMDNQSAKNKASRHHDGRSQKTTRPILRDG